MDLSRLALPEALSLAGWIAALPLLALAVRRVRWREAAAGPVAGATLGRAVESDAELDTETLPPDHCP